MSEFIENVNLVPRVSLLIGVETLLWSRVSVTIERTREGLFIKSILSSIVFQLETRPLREKHAAALLLCDVLK